MTLNDRMADAINAATDHLLMAIDYVAGGTDKIDGDIARSRNLITDFGKSPTRSQTRPSPGWRSSASPWSAACGGG